ncbi:MAG: HU family DNA-binding protein, partial [Clostridia bacterium]|nr:HU family DNA-binding protein [Clostridia bacterium]
KTDLVAGISEKVGISRKEADKMLSAVLEVITEALAKGEKIQLVGFGTFEVKERAARKGHNPQTKEEIEIPACKVPSFKAGKNLKEAVFPSNAD